MTIMPEYASEPGDHDSAAKSITALKNELADEKLAWEKPQTDVETFPRHLKN
jgi:hypothetical protein